MAASLAAVALLATTLGPADSAQAAESVTYPTANAGVVKGSGTGYLMGNYRGSNGEIAWCGFDLDETAPNNGSKPAYGDVQDASSWTARGAGSATSTLAPSTIARIAYVLAKWGSTSSDTTAGAVYWLIHDKAGVPRGEVHLTQAQKDLAASMWDEAVKYAGPYTTSLTLSGSVTDRADLSEGTAGAQRASAVFGTTSAAGTYLSGRTQVLTITGPGRWKLGEGGTVSGDGKTLTVNSSTAALTRTVLATGHGVVTVKIDVDVPASTFKWRATSAAGYQRVVLAGQTVSKTASDSLRLTGEWGYEIATRALNLTRDTVAYSAGAVLLEPGDRVADRLVVATTDGTWPSGYQRTATSVLYGPLTAAPTQRSTVPSGTPVRATRTTTIAGAGTYETGYVVVTEPGWYVWRETVPADDYSSAWSGDYGLTVESARMKWSPSLTTQRSSASAVPGGSVRDTLTITGAAPGAELTAKATLYYHGTSIPTERSTVPSTATKVITQTMAGTPNSAGNLTLTTPGYTLPAGVARGYYTWVAELVASSTSNAYVHNYGVPAETFVVEWTPSITTAASAYEAIRGGQVRDRITLSGHRPGQSVALTARLYYHGAGRPPQTPTAPSGAVLLETFAVPVTVGASGAATAYTPWWTVPADAEVGYYTWVVSAPRLSGVSAAYTSDYGIDVETFRVSEAQIQISTTASTQVAAPGTVVRDLITLDTTSDLEAFPAVVDHALWGPFSEQPTLSDEVPAGAPLAWSGQETRTNADPYTTGAYLIPDNAPPGFYTYTASVRATTDYDAVHSAFGEATETFLVPWRPTVATVTSDQVAGVGSEIRDYLTVDGARPGVSFDVVSTLLGPFDDIPVLSQQIPADAPAVGQVITTVVPDAAGHAEARTEPVTLTEAGYYVWVESIAAAPDGSSTAWQSPFGVASEVTLVPWSPQVVTQTSHQVAEPGTLLTDELRISGMWPHSPATVHSVLYGPFDAAPVLADDVPAGAPVAGDVWTTVPTDANGDGVQSTEPIRVTEAGYYVWVESIAASPDDIWTAWQSPFGVATEVSVVPWSPKVVTQTSRQVAAPGAQLSDWIVVSDGQPNTSVLVESVLIGPLGSAPVLSDVIPADAPVAGRTSTTLELDHVGRAGQSTDPITITEAGWYVWVESIAGAPDGSSTAWESPFGVATEVTVVPWSPKVVTQTSREVAAPGTVLSDTLTVSDLPPSSSVDVVSRLLGPFGTAPTLLDEIPSGAPVAGTVTTSVTADETGTATAQTTGVTVSSAGYYVWVESIAAAPDGSYTAWQSPFGVATEVTLVPWSPKVTTRTSQQVAAPGAQISDRLFVSDGQPGTTATVESILYGPFTSAPVLADTIPADAPIAGRTSTAVTLDATGEAEARTEAITLTSAGYYVWVESIAAAPDGSYTAWQSRFGVTNEVTLISWSPKVATQTSAQVAEPGTVLTDTLTVSDLPPSSTVDVVSQLLYTGAVKPELSEQIPADAVLVGSVTTSVTADQAGRATTRTDGITIEDAGWYVWVESIVRASDGSHVGWTSPFGVATEVSLVRWRPRVVTQTSASVVGPDTAVSDHLQVSGLRPGEVVDVESVFYGPFTTQPELADQVPADAPVAGKVTTTVTGDRRGTVEATTDPIKVSTPGYYVWVESIAPSVDGQRLGWQAPFGVASETTRVTEGPVIRTAAAHTRDGVHHLEAWDTLRIEGTWLEPATVVVELVYAGKGRDLVADGEVIWTSQDIAITDDVREYKTDVARIDLTGRKGGTYGFIDTAYAADGTVISRGVLGDVDETFQVPDLPVTGPSGVVPTALIAGILTLLGAVALVSARLIRRRHARGAAH